MIGRRVAADCGGAGAHADFGRADDRRYRRVAFDVTLGYRKAVEEQASTRRQSELEAAVREFERRTANGERRAAS